jgi:hypothetical protein
VNITVRDNTIIKTTVIEDGNKMVDRVQTYTLADIAKGIETCNRLIAQLPLEKGHNWQHNLACVEAEKALWESYRLMISTEMKAAESKTIVEVKDDGEQMGVESR